MYCSKRSSSFGIIMSKSLLTIILLFTVFVSSHALAAPPAEAFGELPTVHDAAISPDGNTIAVMVNLDGQYGVAIIPRNSDAARKAATVGLGKGLKPKWVKWANNDQVLISVWSSFKLYGTPVTGTFLYSMNADTMKGKYLARPKNVTRQFNDRVVDFLEDDPDHILMAFSNENVIEPDIKRVHVVSGNTRTIKSGKNTIQHWYTDTRGEPRIGQGLSDRKTEKWRLVIRDKDQDKWRDSDKYPGLPADADIHGFTSNHDELVIGARLGKDKVGLYVYDLAVKKITRTLFYNDDYDTGGVVYSADGKDIVGAKYVSEESETVLFDEYDSVLSKVRAQYSGYTVDYVDQSKNGERILVKISNAHSAGGLMIVDGKTAEVGRLSYIRPKLPSNEMGEVITIRYTARDGTKIPGYVTVPPTVKSTADMKKVPFIILPHGGPFARRSKRFDYFVQFFASRGYGVLQMNFRGSTGFGEAFHEAGRKNWVVMQEDVEDGTKWLIEKGYADPKRTCIAGWSYGGYAALMGAIKHPDLYACSISIAGLTDIQDQIRDMQDYRFGKLAAKNTFLDGFESKDALKDNSPVRRADEITIPVFLAHGSADQRVHYDQFKRMKSKTKNSPNLVALGFKDEDHFFSNQKNRQEMLIELEKFLEKSNGKSEFMTP